MMKSELLPDKKPRLSPADLAEHAEYLRQLFDRATLKRIYEETGIEVNTLRQVKFRLKAGEIIMQKLKECGL